MPGLVHDPRSREAPRLPVPCPASLCFFLCPCKQAGSLFRRKSTTGNDPGKGESSGAFSLSIASPRVAYYLTGPQQARLPDGYFEKGTRVRLVSGAGSYSVVESETGVTAYVPTDSLEEPR